MWPFKKKKLRPKRPKWRIHYLELKDLWMVECLYDYDEFKSWRWLGRDFITDRPKLFTTAHCKEYESKEKAIDEIKLYEEYRGKSLKVINVY